MGLEPFVPCYWFDPNQTSHTDNELSLKKIPPFLADPFWKSLTMWAQEKYQLRQNEDDELKVRTMYEK